jgi:hypothetical protein
VFWVNGEIDLTKGTIQGWNVPQRVVVSDNAVPGTRHLSLVSPRDGPFGNPIGGIFIHHVTLAFETRQ